VSKKDSPDRTVRLNTPLNTGHPKKINSIKSDTQGNNAIMIHNKHKQTHGNRSRQDNYRKC